MYQLRRQLFEIVAEFKPMTVRQVFYQAVSRGLIDKTESEYKATICRILADMRRDGEMPYWWIADNTRLMRKPQTYGSLGSMLDSSQQFYRRALWQEQDAYVEVWLEKEALSGVLYDVTAEFDVPLMVTRGYPSLSFLYSAAEKINYVDSPIYLYYFGDHAPSGVDIPRFVRETLEEMAEDAYFEFRRVAILPHQIESMKLQTRPTKKSDSRSKSFEGESVEVDAIHPNTLRQMCRDVIEQHIDPEILEATQTAEAAERETLEALGAIAHLGAGKIRTLRPNEGDGMAL